MPKRIAMLAYPGVQHLDVAGPLEVFAMASRCLGTDSGHPYRVEVIGIDAGPVQAVSGLEIRASRSLREVADSGSALDTLLVPGGHGIELVAGDPHLCALLRDLAPPRIRRLGSVCTGAFALAAAGLLDGRRAVTHWAHCAELAARFPSIEVVGDPIFVRDGAIYTSAGITAGLDLALALVEEDHGRDLALTVARRLVM